MYNCLYFVLVEVGFDLLILVFVLKASWESAEVDHCRRENMFTLACLLTSGGRGHVSIEKSVLESSLVLCKVVRESCAHWIAKSANFDGILESIAFNDTLGLERFCPFLPGTIHYI